MRTTTLNHEGTAIQGVVKRSAADRGQADHGWLKSQHTFSFADYYDPQYMGFRSLRVINEDRVEPGHGFGTHPHRDMEIFSYVLEGALAHKDSLGNGRTLKPGRIQLMSAGRGVTHSEFNPSRGEGLHFLQIWIQPREQGLTPSYTEWHPKADNDSDPKVLVISPDGRDGSATIHQDAEVYRLRLKPAIQCRISSPPAAACGCRFCADASASTEPDLKPATARAANRPAHSRFGLTMPRKRCSLICGNKTPSNVAQPTRQSRRMAAKVRRDRTEKQILLEFLVFFRGKICA
jgi:uncharacterized cupin superfamily protein